MKFYKSIIFKLFLILFLLLTSFVCITIFIQIFVVGRSYTMAGHTVEKERNIEFFTNDFINRTLDNKGNFGKIPISSVEKFEDQNNVNLVIFDNELKNQLITENTKKNIDSYYIDYIKKETKKYNLSMHSYPYVGGHMPLFRIYNKYNFPTKYVVYESRYKISQNNYIYVATIIPEVFTSKSSGILKRYIVYICLFLIIVILIVSAIFAYLVAKPILKINKTASQIANLDFSEKCMLKNEDEIGNLSKTINTMSHNLENTLNKLNSANNKLQKDLNLEKELNLLRKEFLGAVTHEFKTPITLIRGYTESIKDDVAQGEERELALKTIIQETENMDRLVKDLLELSTLESVEFKLNISEFYINEVMFKVGSKYEKVLKEKNILLKCNDCNNILVKGDKFRIEQVLSNFVNNAIDNTANGASITLSLKNKEAHVLVSVENEGKNINETEKNRIWEKFYRLEKSRNKNFGGIGLGLAISKSILELHNSNYGVENTTNGVCFFFTLETLEDLH